MTIQELKKKYSSKINPQDLDLLLEFVLKKTRENLLTHPEVKIPLRQLIKLKYFLRQLQKNKPINYIIGRKEFYGLDFKINSHTLIPRPETEQMIDLTKKIIINSLQNNSQTKFTFIDLGTGSGNIIITLAKYIQRAYFYASDISRKALAVAKINTQYHQVNIKFTEGNLLEPFKKLLTTRKTTPIISGCCGNVSAHCSKLSPADVKKKVLIITANLPYLSTKIYNSTAQNIKDYEPIEALVSGKDGLNHYRHLLNQLNTLCKNKKFSFSKVYLLLEISPEQKTKIAQEIEQIFPSAKITLHKDLAQKWRIVKIKITK
jgi:release factor glutamine methyltransferase